jgi:purine catabolism regulator
LNIREVLKIKSLNEAKLIAGKQGVINEVGGINILEAIDIENWGRPGDIILSSYFALQNLSDSEMDDFFQKLHNISISAVIIKIDRLVGSIPDKIIELCNKYLIPLIQIGRDVKYESIILEILGPIINRNVSLLNKYYEVHSELTSLALKMPSMEDILLEFKKMLQRDVSIINTVNGTEVCTNPELRNMTVLETSEVLPEKYMHFKYLRKAVVYKDTNEKIIGNQLSVRIPNLGYDNYELVIHELSDQISSRNMLSHKIYFSRKITSLAIYLMTDFTRKKI